MWDYNTWAAAIGTIACLVVTPTLGHALSYSTLYTFTGSNGRQPTGGLTELGGLLYGTVPSGIADGFVFSITPSGNLKNIETFGTGHLASAAGPGFAPLPVGNNFYVVTTETLDGASGTVSRVPIHGGGKVVHSFDSSGDGKTPSGQLLNVGGVLYGATIEGGANGYGAIYAVSPKGSENVIYSFKGGNDGEYPVGSLLAVEGVLYGVTSKGGGTTGCQNFDPHDFSCGTVFSVTPAGVETLLHIFHKSKDGGLPMAGLSLNGSTLLGTATIGGPANCTYQKGGCGVIYSINNDGSAFKVVHSFQGPPDGAAPSTPLLNVNGTFYGTTGVGGSTNPGTIFSFNPSSETETVLYSFSDDEGYPSSGVTMLDGTFYGETYGNGSTTFGVIYGFTP